MCKTCGPGFDIQPEQVHSMATVGTNPFSTTLKYELENIFNDANQLKARDER